MARNEGWDSTTTVSGDWFWWFTTCPSHMSKLCRAGSVQYAWICNGWCSCCQEECGLLTMLDHLDLNQVRSLSLTLRLKHPFMASQCWKLVKLEIHLSKFAKLHIKIPVKTFFSKYFWFQICFQGICVRYISRPLSAFHILHCSILG